MDLCDRYGITQLVFNQESDGVLFEKANHLEREYVIQVVDEVAERSSKNLQMPTGEIEILVNEIAVPIIVDAGIGRPSQACEAMEMGVAAVMCNTAVATAKNIPLMARAFGQAIESGRNAYLAGLGRVLTQAEASSPLTGFLED